MNTIAFRFRPRNSCPAPGITVDRAAAIRCRFGLAEGTAGELTADHADVVVGSDTSEQYSRSRGHLAGRLLHHIGVEDPILLQIM
jgi:hypothetical protein